MGDVRKRLDLETWLVSAGRSEEPGAPLNVPPVLASNFLHGGQREYSRDDATATWTALETVVGGLEGGSAVAFSSGMAAAAAVFDQLAAGAEVVIPEDCYQGVASLAAIGRDRRGWRVRKLATENTSAWIEAARTADLLWLESPSNPLLTVADLGSICAATRPVGSLLAVDNTFATPLNQRPLELGADVSMQSATKFIGGHSDLLAGVVSSHRPELLEELRRSRILNGATPGALEAFLAVRGARTLAVRLQRCQHNASELARFLEQHPGVRVTRYPGLESHPTHGVAKEQLSGFGSVISFEVQGDAGTADEVCRAVKVVRHATSLGAVESTLERRAAIEGQEHLPPTLIRLSVGIESLDDLRNDLDQAISSATADLPKPVSGDF